MKPETAEAVKTLEALQKERAIAEQRLAQIDAEISARKARTLVRCEANNNGEGCRAAFEVRELEYIQTHWYVRPHGCTEGDYWNHGEGQWVCPSCGHRNRLYNQPDVEKMKPLFKSVKDTYDKR